MRNNGLWFRKCGDKTRKVSKMEASSEIINIVIFLLIIKLVYTKVQKSKTESIIQELVSKIQELTPMKERSEDNDELRFSNHTKMIQNNRKIATLVPECIDSIKENQSIVYDGLSKHNAIVEYLNNEIPVLANICVHESDIVQLSDQLFAINDKYVSDLSQVKENIIQNSVALEEIISQQDLSKQKIGEFISYLKNQMRTFDGHISVINKKIKEDY